MASFLIDRHSPFKSGVTRKLRHYSRYSESDKYSWDTASMSPTNDNLSSTDKKNVPLGFVDKELEDNDNLQVIEKKAVKSKSMLSYFMKELTRDYRLEGDASEFTERRDRVYTSVNTPKNLEKFCAFGFLQCLDSILYMVTFLPLRIIVAIVRVLTYPCAVVFTGSKRMLDGAQVCDLLKGVILVVSYFIASEMDMSQIYHEVKKQTIIKFYVIYNMLDVLDKLISGFGQDVLDSLYWTAVEPRGRKREHFGTLFHLIFAIAYVVVHTLIILTQAVILNVAFNSTNKSLLTILMSNNFVEIKGNLFKRLDKNHLCQITYSDIKERFHYVVLLLFVFIRNVSADKWSWNLALPVMQDAFLVLFVEILVDWIKHAFITKSNELSASLYADFALGLAQDIASSQKKHAFTNFSDQVCRRMGFTPIPLICLLIMVCNKSFRISGFLPWLLVFLFYLCLMSTKVLISIILLGWAQRLITERDKTTKSTGTVVNSQVMPKKEDKGPPTKAKSKTEVPIPVIITSHPITVSSSIAVNADSSLTVDSASLISVTQSNENSSTSSFQNEKAIKQTDRDFIVSQNGIFTNLHSQELDVNSSTDRFLAQSDEEIIHLPEDTDFSRSLIIIHTQQTPSLHLIPQFSSDETAKHNGTIEQTAACDLSNNVNSETVAYESFDVQTNPLFQNQSSATSLDDSADKPVNISHRSYSV